MNVLRFLEHRFGERQCNSSRTNRSARASPVRACRMANEMMRIMLAANVIDAPVYSGWSPSVSSVNKKEKLVSKRHQGLTITFSGVEK